MAIGNTILNRRKLLPPVPSLIPTANHHMLASAAVDSGVMRPEKAANEGTIQIWVCDVCKTSKFDDFLEACRHEEACMNGDAQKKMESLSNLMKPSGEATKFPSKNKSLHAFFTCRQRKPDESVTTIDNPTLTSSILGDSTKGNVAARKRKDLGAPFSSSCLLIESDPSAEPKKKKKDVCHFDRKMNTESPLVNLSEGSKGVRDTASPEDSALAAIFGICNTSASRAEQRARIAKGCLADPSLQKNWTPTIAPRKYNARQHPKRLNPDRFPVLSHIGVFGSEDGNTSKYGDVLSTLRKTLKHSSGNDKNGDDVAPYRHIQAPAIPSAVDINFRMLSSAFVVSKAINLEDHELWSRKYTIRNIPSDVCGEINKRVAKRCTGFVEEWKVERQKALMRRADKQDRLARGKKMPSKKKKVDDLWDDASDDNQSGLPSICLLTGPVGCGKTSLVYAIARSCECKVMEINTTDKRSHQNLKNAIEEATQSGSTMEMLKNRAAAPLIFSKRHAAHVDSEDDDSDEEGSAVPIVLVDEVDLIFENDGDSGFWPALKALAKRAKCPIFLTANAIPQALRALSIRFKHYSMERPTPEECMSQIWKVVKSENLEQRPNLLRDQVKQALVDFAERHECDLRRILLEMQLFARARNFVTVLDPDLVVLDKASNPPDFRFLGHGPVVNKIIPNAVPAEQQSRLELAGRGFASLPQNFSVSIGEQVCEAEVVNDTTISATCPPFQMQETSFIYSSRFPLVKIEAPPTISRSVIGTRLKPLELHNGSTMLSVSHDSIEFLLPSLSSDASAATISKAHSQVTKETPSVRQLHTEISIENPTTVHVPVDGVGDKNLRGLEVLSQLANNLERQSDAVSMAHSMYGIPWLGGATHGFASQFVDGFATSSDPTSTNKLCRDNNAKPPPIERILFSGWNDSECYFGDSDVYVTNPGLRDRQLYSQMARFGRLGSFSASIQSTEDADDLGQEDIQTKHFPCTPDEDSFILRKTLLGEISSTLTNLIGESPRWGQLTNQLKNNRRKRLMRMTNKFFCELWHDSNACQVFARGVARDVDADEHFDARIFLDYGPIVSQICFYEVAAACVSDANTGGVQSSSRRTTRRSKESTRAHHFMKVNQGLFEEDCREMGRNRAALLLRYGCTVEA